MPVKTMGQLRHRVTIRKRTDTKDASGYRDSPAYSTIGPLWAHIETVSGAEVFEASQKLPYSTHRITIRHRTDVNSEDEITATLHGQARVFNILGMRRLPEEKIQWLELLVEERQGA